MKLYFLNDDDDNEIWINESPGTGVTISQSGEESNFKLALNTTQS